MPVMAELAGHGRAVRPLSPVHGRIEAHDTGAITLRWTRRSRNGFTWRDLVEVPLGEELEAYRVSLIADGVLVAEREASLPEITLDTVTMAEARSRAPHPQPRAVVQRGARGISPPLVLALPL